MKIKNISDKIIGVENIVLMPDDSSEFDSKVAEIPTVKKFISMKWLEVSEEPATKEVKAEFSMPEPVEEANVTAESPAPEKKRGRKAAQ